MLTVQRTSKKMSVYLRLSCAYIYSLGACVRIVSRFILKTQPEESEFGSTLRNKMKAMIVLLAAAFACGAPHQNLKSIIKGCSNICLEKELCKSVFVNDLKNKNMCEVRDRQAEFLCQAEKVLSEVKFPTVTPHCNVTKLLRNLKVYNNGMNCTVPTNEVEIDLGSFLEDLTKCAKKVFSRMPPTQFPQ